MSTRAPTVQPESVELPPADESDFQLFEEGIRSRIDQGETEATRHEGASRSKKRISASLVFSSTLIALLAVLFAAVGHRAYKHLFPQPQVPWKIGDFDIDTALGALRSSVDDLSNQWSSSSAAVKQAFSYHYIPTVDEREKPLADPLEAYLQHARALLDSAPKKGSVPEQTESEYIIRVMLVDYVLRGASWKLIGLSAMEQLNQDLGIEAPLLGLPGAERALSEAVIALEGGCSFDTFKRDLIKVCEREDLEREDIKSPDSTVSHAVEVKFINLVRLFRRDFEDRGYLSEVFGHILERMGLEAGLQDENLGKLKPLYAEGHQSFFDFSSYGAFLSSKPGDPISREFLQDVAAHWTDKGLRTKMQQLLEQQKKQIRNDLKARRQQMKRGWRGKPVARDSLYALALFLV